MEPIEGYDAWKLASPYDEYPEEEDECAEQEDECAEQEFDAMEREFDVRPFCFGPFYPPILREKQPMREGPRAYWPGA